MNEELNCMNCSIGDFKRDLCDCNNGFCKEFKSIGKQEDFFNAVMQRIRPQDDDWEKYSDKLWKNAYERGKADGAMIYGNEHNCIMTIFGECSYAETGCGDCAVVEKVRKALSADRPQGEWEIAGERFKYIRCPYCKTAKASSRSRFCDWCGARMKGVEE